MSNDKRNEEPWHLPQSIHVELDKCFHKVIYGGVISTTTDVRSLLVLHPSLHCETHAQKPYRSIQCTAYGHTRHVHNMA